MENVEVGDIVGWHIRIWHNHADAEITGTVVAVENDFLCLRSNHVNSKTCNPFHGRHRSLCHMVTKQSEDIAIAAE